MHYQIDNCQVQLDGTIVLGPSETASRLSKLLSHLESNYYDKYNDLDEFINQSEVYPDYGDDLFINEKIVYSDHLIIKFGNQKLIVKSNGKVIITSSLFNSSKEHLESIKKIINILNELPSEMVIQYIKTKNELKEYERYLIND